MRTVTVWDFTKVLKLLRKPKGTMFTSMFENCSFATFALLVVVGSSKKCAMSSRQSPGECNWRQFFAQWHTWDLRTNFRLSCCCCQFRWHRFADRASANSELKENDFTNHRTSHRRKFAHLKDPQSSIVSTPLQSILKVFTLAIQRGMCHLEEEDNQPYSLFLPIVFVATNGEIS